MSKGLDAFGRIVDKSDLKIKYGDGLPKNQDTEDVLFVNKLVNRDEAKQVSYMHPRKAVGKCSICYSIVHLIHHKNFCGNCGNRLGWGKHEKLSKSVE